MRFAGLAVLGAAVVLTFSGCGGSSDRGEPVGSVEMVDGGSWFVREPWPHDGKPVESENFVVYSDNASMGARRKTAEVADAIWADLLEDFSIEPGMLQYPEGQERLHIYAYCDKDPRDWEARAYFGGLIMWSPDHPDRRSQADTRFAPVLEHELVHVLQWAIAGRPDPNPLDVWFVEGLPEAVVGGTASGAIRGLDELDALTAGYGTISPISYRTESQIKGPDAGEHFNYPMFQLAVEYLLDEDGYGRSLTDARDVMIDVAAGSSFDDAFEERMGVSLATYDGEFFDLMDDYLPQHRNRVFTPIGFAALSVLVVALVVGVPAVSARRWRTRPTAAPIEAAIPGRAARAGFHIETVLAGVVIMTFFLGAMFAVGTANELNNTMYAAGRSRAYAILVGYLLVSVGLVTWTVRRWIDGSRLAFLVAPLVIVATAVAMVVVVGTIV